MSDEGRFVFCMKKRIGVPGPADALPFCIRVIRGIRG
jgi:hypothetical protein